MALFIIFFYFNDHFSRTTPPHYVLFIPEQFSGKAHTHSLGRGGVIQYQNITAFIIFYFTNSHVDHIQDPLHSVLFIPEQFIGKAHR
jgi:hypothetical protein